MRILRHPMPPGNSGGAWADLPAEILERLALDGVNSAEGWRRLSRTKRNAIFGITPRHVAEIDRAVGRL